MPKNKFKRNLFFNGLQQAFTLILPFLTVPYLTRVIGPDGIGIYTYTNSIVQYFILFGTIGLSLYGTRQIAYVKNDDKSRNNEFQKIFNLKLFFCVISLAAYILFVTCFAKEYKVVLLIQSLAIVNAIIDITWYFQGIEEFDKIATRSILCRIVGTICIFLFVRSKNDVVVYTFIQMFINVVSNSVMWVIFLRHEKIVKISFNKIFEHLRPAIDFFVPQIAVELYAVFDKTMIGLLSTVTQVGLYSKAEEFAKVPLILVSVLATVLFPRMSNLFQEKGEHALVEQLNKNLLTVSFIGIGAGFGIIGISDEFVPWMMGEQFLDAISLLKILAPLTFVIGLSNMLGRQFLLPVDKIKVFTVTVTMGAVVNMVLNSVLIGVLGAIGACIATIIAESIVTISQFIYLKNKIYKRILAIEILKCFASGIVMYFVVAYIGVVVHITILNTFVQIVSGALIYLCLCLLLKCKSASQIKNLLIRKR